MAAVGEKTTDAVEVRSNGQFIGCEIRISADPNSGGIMVNSTHSNIIVTLGLLEVAKEILLEQQRAAMKSAPAIKSASMSDLKSFGRKPS